MNDTQAICTDETRLPPSHDHPAMFSKELIEPLAARIRGRRHVLVEAGKFVTVQCRGVTLEPQAADVASGVPIAVSA